MLLLLHHRIDHQIGYDGWWKLNEIKENFYLSISNLFSQYRKENQLRNSLMPLLLARGFQKNNEMSYFLLTTLISTDFSLIWFILLSFLSWTAFDLEDERINQWKKDQTNHLNYFVDNWRGFILLKPIFSRRINQNQIHLNYNNSICKMNERKSKWIMHCAYCAWNV